MICRAYPPDKHQFIIKENTPRRVPWRVLYYDFLLYVLVTNKSLEQCLRVDSYEEVVGVVDVIARIIVEGLGQRITETGQMHTALGSNDIIYITVGALIEGVVVLQGNLNINTVYRAFTVNNI